MRSQQERQIRHMLGLSKASAPVASKFKKRELVRVTAGPFTEFTGEVREVNLDAEKLTVLISIFGQTTPV